MGLATGFMFKPIKNNLFRHLNNKKNNIKETLQVKSTKLSD